MTTILHEQKYDIREEGLRALKVVARTGKDGTPSHIVVPFTSKIGKTNPVGHWARPCCQKLKGIRWCDDAV